MKAIILAAGVGRRMRPLTVNAHKTLLKIGNRTLLDRLIDTLTAHGIVKIAVVTGYRSEDVCQHSIEHHPLVDFLFIHNERYAETNNIYSLAMAIEKVPIDDEVVSIESDLVVEPAVLARLFASPHPNVALVDRYRSGMDGTVVTVANGIVSLPPHE